MDKKSKILLAVFFALIIISVGVTYWKTIIKRDYVIESQIDCDPYTEACFIWECDPGSTEEGEACTGDPEVDVWYYKIAKRNAGNIPECDPEVDETCDPWTCEEGERDCEEILCDEVTAEEQGVTCNDPEEYTLNNPPEEEDLSDGEAECNPELDEECIIEEESSSDEIECDPLDDLNCVTEEASDESDIKTEDQVDGDAEGDIPSSTVE